ncbi:MAG: hypothetical protein IPK60_18855 [Sandaracinaceae bacterium]|nr:hypothetical protein [Sandaracinaceae bacterium]
MTIAAVVAIFAAAVGFVVAALTLGFSMAPGWREKRWFSVVSLSQGAYSAFNTIFTLHGVSDGVNISVSRVQMSCAYVFGATLIVYTVRRLGKALSVVDKVLIGLTCAAIVAAYIPNGLYTNIVDHEYVPALGLTYAIVRPTTFGAVLMSLIAIDICAALAHFLAAARNGVQGLAAPCTGLGISLLVALCDVFTSSGLLPFPYLADVGFMIFIALIGVEMVQRFVEGAKSLERLTERLEVRVKERTLELNSMHSQLLRAEKLAAIGQLSAGVAHEINNPAAAIEANLRYLDRALLEEYEFPEDARDCVDESLMGVQRIARIVRQLLDAGRSASQTQGHEYPLCQAIDAAARAACTATRRHVEIDIRVSNELIVAGDQQLLEQVFANVLTNAIQAMPPEREGKITIEATEEDDLVQVLVQDSGTGMSEQTLKRALEPFFTTRALNEGTGLGLSVSLGLLHAVNGELWIESELGVGTRVHVMLRKPSRAQSTGAFATVSGGY